MLNSVFVDGLLGCGRDLTTGLLFWAGGVDLVDNGRIKLALQVPIVEEVLPIFGSPQVNKRSLAVLTAEGGKRLCGGAETPEQNPTTACLPTQDAFLPILEV